MAHRAPRSLAGLVLVLSLAAGCGASPSAPAQTPPTTVAQVGDRPADQGALGRLARTWPNGSTLRFAIRWTSPGTTWLYDGTLSLTRTGTGVTGVFEWRLLSTNATMPELASRIGSTAVEQIAGVFDPSQDALVLHTTSISDETLVGAASYRMSLASDGLHGITAGAEDGVWDGVLDGVPTAP
jgi:hypothetical protein